MLRNRGRDHRKGRKVKTKKGQNGKFGKLNGPPSTLSQESELFVKSNRGISEKKKRGGSRGERETPTCPKTN